MPTAILADYSYQGLVEGLRARGWRVLHSDASAPDGRPDLSWYAWAHGNVPSVPRGSALAYGRHLREVARVEGADLVLLGKASDSNVRAPDQDPPYWHVRSEDAALLKSDLGAVVLLLSLDSPDDTGWTIRAGLHSVVDAIGNCCVGTRSTYRDHGQPNLFEFWPAWDQASRTITPATAERPVDFCFVGSPYLAPNPEFGCPRRDIVLAALSLGLKVELYGSPDWLHGHLGGDPALADVYLGQAPFDALEGVYARAKVVYSSFLRRGFRYLNDRVPIAAGAGAFCLLEEQLGLDGELPEGVMVGYHKRADLASFRDRLSWWVAHDAERVACAGRMQSHVLARHTYQHRADTILSEYEAARRRRREAKKACCGGG